MLIQLQAGKNTKLELNCKKFVLSDCSQEKFMIETSSSTDV